jgi:outer membrane lipoprotein-sorting protein
MRWITLAALVLVAAPVYGQENDAEKLYRAMEQKIRGAKSIHFVFDGTLSGEGNKGALKGEVWMAEGEKANMTINGDFGGQPMKMLVISDGKKAYTKYNDKDFTKDNDEKHYAKALGMIARMGMLAAFTMASASKETDLDKLVPVKDFKLGAKEKVGKHDTQVVEFNVSVPGEPGAKVLVWIDTQTKLPVKRELVGMDKKGGEGRISETFSTFEIDPKVDAKVFELPK